jgi:outer membrane receptor protein involved in Fe transport
LANIGAVPVYTSDYGWLDAAITYRYNQRLTLSMEGANLLNTRRTSYYGVKTRPSRSEMTDTRVSFRVMLQI